MQGFRIFYGFFLICNRILQFLPQIEIKDKSMGIRILFCLKMIRKSVKKIPNYGDYFTTLLPVHSEK